MFLIYNRIFINLIFIISKTWIQAEKRGVVKNWRGWNGWTLNRQDWFNSEKNDKKDEPQNTDMFGYMYYGKVYGARENATSQYV